MPVERIADECITIHRCVERAANGRTMRFEEGEASRWMQVPQSANPLLMVRK